jgi:hypothetical protein
VIHVYAFAQELEHLPESAGLDGAPLERRSVDGVTAVFSRRTAASSQESLRDDALAHGAVVDALMERATAVLPVRFGEVVADEAALDASVEARMASLRRAFADVRDCVELALRVWAAAAPEAETPVTGADYLRVRAAEESHRRAAVDALHCDVSSLARAVSLRSGAAAPGELLSAAYLVPRRRVEDARGVVEAFADAHEALTVVCTGPWPPFSFVEEAA